VAIASRGAKWANLGDLQPPKPPERSGRVISRQAEKKASAPSVAAAIGNPCGYCGATMTKAPAGWPGIQLADTDITRDHAFPKSQGWRLDDFDGANRALCCYRCNNDKGANDIVDWHARLHAGRDPRAPLVFAIIQALWKSQQTSPSFPAGVRAKLNLAILRVNIPAGSHAAMALAKDAKTRSGSPRRAKRTANQGQASGNSVAS
jgi:hypothetical protein